MIAYIMKLLCLNTAIQYVNVQVHRHVHALNDRLTRPTQTPLKE